MGWGDRIHGFIPNLWNGPCRKKNGFFGPDFCLTPQYVVVLLVTKHNILCIICLDVGDKLF